MMDDEYVQGLKEGMEIGMRDLEERCKVAYRRGYKSGWESSKLRLKRAVENNIGLAEELKRVGLQLIAIPVQKEESDYLEFTKNLGRVMKNVNS